jgi:hypothetical protein
MSLEQQPPGPPMTLGNMRHLGVLRVYARATIAEVMQAKVLTQERSDESPQPISCARSLIRS